MKLRDIDKEMMLAVSLIVLAAGTIGLLIFSGWKTYSTPTQEEAVVESVSYTPSETSTGVGVGVSSSGDITTMPVTSSTSEQYVIVFLFRNGRYHFENKDVWGWVKPGQKVFLVFREARNRHGELVGYDFITMNPMQDPQCVK